MTPIRITRSHDHKPNMPTFQNQNSRHKLKLYNFYRNFDGLTKKKKISNYVRILLQVI